MLEDNQQQFTGVIHDMPTNIPLKINTMPANAEIMTNKSSGAKIFDQSGQRCTEAQGGMIEKFYASTNKFTCSPRQEVETNAQGEVVSKAINLPYEEEKKLEESRASKGSVNLSDSSLSHNI